MLTESAPSGPELKGWAGGIDEGSFLRCASLAAGNAPLDGLSIDRGSAVEDTMLEAPKAMLQGAAAESASFPKETLEAPSWLKSGGQSGNSPSMRGESSCHEAEYAVGEKVLYWSETYSLWMPASVTRHILENGTIVSYDLDVRRGAQASRMRHMPTWSEAPAAVATATAAAEALLASEAGVRGSSVAVAAAGAEDASLLVGQGLGAGSSASGLVESTVLSNAQASQASLLPSTSSQQQRFEVGDRVLYWSDTHRLWMQAVVQRVRNGGELYDLDVKRGANIRRMKPAHVASTAGQAESAASQAPPATAAAPACGTSSYAVPRPGDASPAKPQRDRAGCNEAAPTQQAGGSVASKAPPTQQAGGSVASKTVLRAANPPGEANGSAIKGALPSGTATRTPATTTTLFMGTGVESRRSQTAAAVPAAYHARHAEPTRRRAVVAGAIRDTATCHLTTSKGYPSMVSATNVVSAGGTLTNASVIVGATPPGSPPRLEVGEIQCGNQFDPQSTSVRTQLLTKLGLSCRSVIEEMKGFRGGLNEGIWFVKNCGREDLVLKLVRPHRVAQCVPTETENLIKICREHPSMAKDPCLAFPVKIFTCLSSTGTKLHDLIVMRRVRGERLAELIARKWYANQVSQLMQVFERIGQCLADFHRRYGNSQHGDFQPSNVFVDEERGDIVLIDIGGIGVPTMETDIEHFAKSMELLADTYGPAIARDGVRYFEQGYRDSSSGVFRNGCGSKVSGRLKGHAT